MRIARNMGPADRLVRLVVGTSLVLFGALGLVPGGWRLLLPVLGVAVATTALIGYCPLYQAVRLGWKGEAGRHEGGHGG